jgi:hypothetical protein
MLDLEQSCAGQQLGSRLDAGHVVDDQQLAKPEALHKRS